MASLRGNSRSSKSSSTDVMRMVPATKWLFKRWGQLLLKVTPSPAELLHGRQMKTTLPAIIKSLHNNEAVRAYLQSRQDFPRYDAQGKERSTLLPTQPVCIQDSTSHRWSQVVVKTKAETPKSYIVETPQGEYRRNRIHLKEAAVNTVPASGTQSSGKRCSLTHRMCKVSPLFPHKNLQNNNKGNSNVSAQCVPNLKSAKVVEKTETKEVIQTT